MFRTLAAFALIAAALPALAQQAEAPADNGLSMGQPVAPDGGAVGTSYVASEYGDFDLRCVRTESGKDPCQLYQLLSDTDGNAVAEFTLFPLLPPQGDAIAGGTIVTPLETLLTQAVTISVDAGEGRRYPFTFCAEIGCVARIGYTDADIDRYKAGKEASVSIVPVLAPDKRISLKVSLNGFTAGYDALLAQMQERAAEAAAASGN